MERNLPGYVHSSEYVHFIINVHHLVCGTLKVYIHILVPLLTYKTQKQLTRQTKLEELRFNNQLSEMTGFTCVTAMLLVVLQAVKIKIRFGVSWLSVLLHYLSINHDM